MASAKEIPPGGEGKINVTFNTTGKQGKQTKRVTVTTNDPVNPTVHLTVSADVAVQFAFDNARVNFGKFEDGSLASRTLTAVGEELAHVSLQSVSLVNKAHESYYTLNVEDSGKGNERSLYLVITPTREIPQGRFFDQLKITTDLPETAPIFIQLSGERAGPVEAFPRSFILRKTAQGTISGSILLRSSDRKPFEVMSATCRDSRAAVTVHAVQSADSMRIDASLPGDFQAPAFRSELVITIAKGDSYDLKVPIFLNPPPPPQPPLPMLKPPVTGKRHSGEKLPGGSVAPAFPR